MDTLISGGMFVEVSLLAVNVVINEWYVRTPTPSSTSQTGDAA